MTTTKEISNQSNDQIKGATNWERFKIGITPYLFISPFYIIFIIFSLLPIAFSIFLSFADWNGMSAIKFTGLDNFITMFHDAKFWNSLRVSLTITAVCMVLGTAGALFLAVALEKVEDRLASILRVIFFLPAVTSVVVITYIWKQMYSTDYGYFNALLTRFGLPPQDWLSDPNLAMPALLVMLIWAGLGWDALIITSGLRSMPVDIYDSGKVDGTNDWTEFRYLTLPLLRPTLLFVLVTSVIYLWGIFAQPNLLTGGGPLRSTQPVAMYLYQQAFTYHKFGYASAIAVILTIIMFISSYLNFRFIRYDTE
jgi:ABC-type sugar transport system permease subunit